MRFACSSLPLKLILNILFICSWFEIFFENFRLFKVENAWIAKFNAHWVEMTSLQNAVWPKSQNYVLVIHEVSNSNTSKADWLYEQKAWRSMFYYITQSSLASQKFISWHSLKHHLTTFSSIIKFHLIITLYLLHLWSKYITFMVSRIITFMVEILLHLWLIFITFMVGVTFMVDFYYIYGWLLHDVSMQDIDIAHRVPARKDSSGPNTIICKFVRRQVEERVMAARKDVSKVAPIQLGYGVQVSLSRLGICDHLSPLNQALLTEEKKVQQAKGFNFCWAKQAQHSLGWQIARAFINWTLFKIFSLCKPVRSRLEQSKQLSILALTIVVCS